MEMDKVRWDFIALAVIAAVAILTVGFVASCQGSWKIFPDKGLTNDYVVRDDEGSRTVFEDEPETVAVSNLGVWTVSQEEPVVETEIRILETHIEAHVVEAEIVDEPETRTWYVFNGETSTGRAVTSYESSWQRVRYVVQDTPTMTELELALNSQHFGAAYEEHVFDCSDMSLLAASILETEYKYNVQVVVGIFVDVHDCHAWISVETVLGWVAVETTWYPEERLGTIVPFAEYEYYNDIYYAGAWEDAISMVNG
ncbi:MAG: hypothetical protein ACNYVW_00435 [Methanosarcinales archaeon]